MQTEYVLLTNDVMESLHGDDTNHFAFVPGSEELIYNKAYVAHVESGAEGPFQPEEVPDHIAKPVVELDLSELELHDDYFKNNTQKGP